VQLGLENKKKTTWAVALAVVALLAVAYEFIPFFTGASEPASSAQAAAPAATREKPRTGRRPGKKLRVENLDPTLKLDLLATSEKTQYEGSGRNIFVSQAENILIPKAIAPGHTDSDKLGPQGPPPVPPPPPIPLKFFGFASRTGEPKKIFLSKDQDVFIAGEGEIVDRRYKVVHISASSVEIQDLVGSGPPQTIPLTPS